MCLFYLRMQRRRGRSPNHFIGQPWLKIVSTLSKASKGSSTRPNDNSDQTEFTSILLLSFWQLKIVNCEVANLRFLAGFRQILAFRIMLHCTINQISSDSFENWSPKLNDMILKAVNFLATEK